MSENTGKKHVKRKAEKKREMKIKKSLNVREDIKADLALELKGSHLKYCSQRKTV